MQALAIDTRLESQIFTAFEIQWDSFRMRVQVPYGRELDVIIINLICNDSSPVNFASQRYSRNSDQENIRPSDSTTFQGMMASTQLL
jgi:hypothetical protein